MKKNIILFFLILSCLSFSNCSHNNKSQDYVYKNITIKNGEKLVQGKEYEVNYRIDHPSNKQYSISVQYQQEKINNFQILSYKLDKIDSIHFAAKIKILPNTSFMTFSLYLPKGELIDISKKIPVYKNSNQLEYGANGALLTNADKSSYLKYFYDERKLYPDNLAIYATRWYYEIGAQLINKDSVLDQIQYLEKNYNAHTTLPLLQIIAYTINYDKTKIDEAIQNIPKVKFDKSLCNWELSSLLNDILFGNDSLHPEQTRLIREQLIQNNPYSFYTHSLINMGVLWNNKNIDSNISINVINKVIDHKPNILNPYITKGIILSEYFLPDSLEELNKILFFLNKSLEKYYNNDEELYYSNNDPFYALYIKRGLVQEIVYNKAKKTGNYDEAINFYKNSIKHFEPTSINVGMTYDMISDFYLKENKKDSAIKYLYYAYYLFPGKPILLDRLNKMMYGNKKVSREKLVAELKAKYQFPAIYLNADTPNIVYADGSQVNLLKINKPKLFIFFNLRCSICEDLMEDFLNSNLNKNDVFVVLISPDDINSLMNFKFYEFFNTKIVANAFDLIKYFDVGFAAPQYIAISSDNRILSKGDGYMKGTVDWAYLFKRDE